MNSHTTSSVKPDTEATLKRYRVRLEMAANADFPKGSPECGYLLEMPLLDDAHIDAESWNENRDKYTVREFWANRDELVGQFLKTVGNVWYFTFYYPNDATELIYRLGQTTFREGELIEIRNEHGQSHRFTIVEVVRIED